MNSATGKKTSWQRIARRIRVPLGFAFAALYLWRANPTRTTLLWSLLLVLPGLWLRAYASGYVKKNSELAVTGPYAYTRNPLYLGSMLMAFGFAAASRRWEILVIFAALFFTIYLPTIFSEEEFLRGAFPAFADYAARVPRLLPRLTPARAPQAESGAFSSALYLRHREYNALMGVAALYAALALRMFFAAR
ncbi:MAG: isoprenylcysteine carboxylmethyltransferase family protein [Acidobacteriaceae bacterium]|nr:isoprenylcysteine carboxylmethyltransferase family protein [Acidobacteriaceae bacterium]